MSQYLSSAEKVVEWAAKLYHESLPLYYDYEYVRMAAALAATLMGRKCVTLVPTTMPLFEPMVHISVPAASSKEPGAARSATKNLYGETIDALYVSLPLFSSYMNQPTTAPENEIKPASDNFNALASAWSMRLRSLGTDRCHDVRHSSRGASGGDNPFELQWTSTEPIDERSVMERAIELVNRGSSGCAMGKNLSSNFRETPLQRFDDSNSVRFQLVIRVVLMVAHWHQHYTRRIPFGCDHRGFRPIELAVAPQQNDSADDDDSSSSSDPY